MMLSRRLLIGCCAALMGVTASSGTSQADVELVGQSDCLSMSALNVRIEAVLATYKPEGASALVVRVAVQDGVDGQSEIELSIVLPDGSLALQRDYQLARQDCVSAEELLVTVIAEFLEALPVKSWSALPTQPTLPTEPLPSPTPEVVASQDPIVHAEPSRERGRLALLLSAMSVVAADASRGREQLIPEAELGMGLALVFDHQTFSLSALARGSTAQELGSGRFRPTTLMGQLAWQRGATTSFGLRLRGGAVRVAGSGFDENFVQYLPWVSAGAQVGYRWRSVQLVAQLMASPLRHEIAIENRDESLWLPRFRLGLGIEYVLGSKKP